MNDNKSPNRNQLISLFIVNIPAICCFIAAAVLAFYGISGWGWFLFAALLITSG
jgi:hypothetical protein